MTRTGRCLCGDIAYEIEGEPLAVALCHCDHCQRQSGGAFSINMGIMADQLTISGDISSYEDRGRTGDEVHVLRQFCGNCGSPILSVLLGVPGVVAVKAGTLDDRSDLAPVMQAWCDDKQPWVEFSDIPARAQED